MGTLPLAPSDLGLGRDAQEERSPSPALSRGASSISQLLSRLVSRKNEGGSRATGGPGQGVGETIPSHRQYSIVGREGVQIVMKKAVQNTSIPLHPLRHTDVTMWRSNWETRGNKCTCFLFLFPWWLEFAELFSLWTLIYSFQRSKGAYEDGSSEGTPGYL